MMNFSEEKIKEIAEELESGYRCYIHLETGEYKSIPDIDEAYLDDELWGDFISEIEDNIDDYFEFEQMPQNDSFKMMKEFITTINDKSLQNHLNDVLSKPKPFRNFKKVIENAGSILEKWFKFKDNKYLEFVKFQIDKFNAEENGTTLNLEEYNAINLFKSGLNCAQAVLSTYSDKLNFDNKLALSISCGFGGGMGRLQETCGAVTGAFMVISIFNCQKYSDNIDRKEKTYSMIQDFNEKFNEIHNTMNCKSLLNTDLKTADGRRFVKENKLDESVCEKCISDSIKIIEEILR